METISERILTYYNNLIKHNVIMVDGPVTLDWLKRQRILDGRKELELRFGSVTVDSVLGEKTPLAKAEQYLNEVRENNKYELLPKIAQLLAEEYNTIVQPDYPFGDKYSRGAREMYSHANEHLYIPYYYFPPSAIYFTYDPDMEYRIFYIEDIISINNFILEHNNFHDDNYSKVSLYIYIRELIYITLVDYFNEIKKQVEYITKQD